ncbi:family S53 protease [Stereum hirsutum FP-91666 SS1]|uniref:family S53 protease n=1 Tax=Stereum hirsutum (strain FP-91666) TaxID=721885 RepID=UPI0004449BA4|nr:family S53 protease [Stereum hirsutum FP-91666 SS1]EIM82266.1 family S53 protease [Stereum hirsutum FP-91666 SS1]
MVQASLVLASLFTLAYAGPHVQRKMHVVERRDSVPSGFVMDGAAPSDEVLTLRFALAQNDIAGLEKELYAVSTPGSSRYRQFLSQDEVQSYVAPAADTVSAVNDWLSANDLTSWSLTPAGDWIAVNMTVSKANSLFDADFSQFTHESTGSTAIRTLEYSVPASLQSAISFVHPTVAFPVKAKGTPAFKKLTQVVPNVNLTSDAVPASCASTITPACLQSIYGVPTTSASAPSNTLAVSGYIDEWANEADLKSFLSTYRTDISSSTTFTLQTLDGGSNPQTASEAGVEANLDIQYTVGIATGVPVSFVSVGEDFNDDVDGFLDQINLFLGQDVPPTVLSTSYSFNENDLTFSVANNLCNAYMQLGALGTSILFSSGDGGVSGGQSSSCTDFVPTYPSTCPYITSVGGTTGISPEVAADFSSGGFSNFFGIPDYQADAVASYLDFLGSTNSGKFNSSGRAFPDMSAQSENFIIAWDGEFGTVDGTSCSTPFFAGMVALINNELINGGGAPLGFLNPLIYSATDAFTDITSGDNPGCNTNGFSATDSWDPVTGVGSPIYSALLAAASSG